MNEVVYAFEVGEEVEVIHGSPDALCAWWHAFPAGAIVRVTGLTSGQIYGKQVPAYEVKGSRGGETVGQTIAEQDLQSLKLTEQDLAEVHQRLGVRT